MTMQLFTFGHPCEHQLRRTCIGGSSCPLNGYPDMWCCSYIKGKINFKRDKPCEGPRCRWGFNHPTQAQFTAVTRVLNEGRAIAGKIDEAEDGEILSFNIENAHTIDTVHCALNMMRHPPSSCAQRVGQLLAYAAVKTGEGKAFMQLLRTMKKPVDAYILGAYAYLKQHTTSGASAAAQLKDSANPSKTASGKQKANTNTASSANKKDDVAEDLKNEMVDLMNAALSQGGHLVDRDDQHQLQAVFIQALRQYPKSNKKRAEMLELALGKFGNRPATKEDATASATSKPAHAAADTVEGVAEKVQKLTASSNNSSNVVNNINNASSKNATGGSQTEKRGAGSAATSDVNNNAATPTITAAQKLATGIAASAAGNHIVAGSATGANTADGTAKASSSGAPAATAAQMLVDSRRAANITSNTNNSIHVHTTTSSSNGATASTSTSVSKSSTARSMTNSGATYSAVVGATSLSTVSPIASGATTATATSATASVTTPTPSVKLPLSVAQAAADLSIASNTAATPVSAAVSPARFAQDKLTLNSTQRRSETPNINCTTPVGLSEGGNTNTSTTTPAGMASGLSGAAAAAAATAASFSLCSASSVTSPHISSIPQQQTQQPMSSEFAPSSSAMFGKRARTKLNISKLASLCTTESSSSPPSPLRSVAYTPVRADSALPDIFILGGQFALTPSMAHAAPLGLASSSGVNANSYKGLSSDAAAAGLATALPSHAAMASMRAQGAAAHMQPMANMAQQQSALFGENLFGNITAEPMFDNLDAAQLFKDFAEGWTN